MGVNRPYGYRPPISHSSFDRSEPAPAPKLPNPDPNNYQVIQAEQIGDYLLLMVQYPDCTNFEGKKILVFRNTTAVDILKQRSLDPHFSDNKTMRSPIARFIPTDDGWIMAKQFAFMMEDQK